MFAWFRRIIRLREAASSSSSGSVILKGLDGSVAGELRVMPARKKKAPGGTGYKSSNGAYMLKGVLARGNIFMRLECTEVASFMSNLKQAQRFKHDTYQNYPAKRGSVFKHLEWTPGADGKPGTLCLREVSAQNTREAVMCVDSATLMILREVVRKTLPELHGF